MTVDHNGRLERYADSAAGASEGQAEPRQMVPRKLTLKMVGAFQEYWKRTENIYGAWTAMLDAAPNMHAPSAEIAALREAMKGAAVIANNAGAEIKDLRRERDHWKANHDFQVARARLLIERTDLPLERVRAYEELAALRERMAGMEKDAARWRIAREFEYVTDFEVLGIDQRIDAAIAKEPK